MEKFPEKSMAPPTFSSTGKLISVRAELFAIKLAPPMLVNKGRVTFSKLGLATKAREEPTEVKFGAWREVK